MRALRLLALAAEAETLLLKREAGAVARSVVWSVLAGGLGIAALVMLHLAGWHALRPDLGWAVSALVLAVADLALAGLCLALARTRNDPIAAEAARLRDLSLQSAGRAAPLSLMMGPGGAGSPLAAIVGAVAEGAVRAWRQR